MDGLASQCQLDEWWAEADSQRSGRIDFVQFAQTYRELLKHERPTDRQRLLRPLPQRQKPEFADPEADETIQAILQSVGVDAWGRVDAK